MELETLRAMNGSPNFSLLIIIEVIALINILFAIVGFAIYLAGVAWLCFKETRQPAPPQMKPEPQETDNYNPIGVSQAVASTE